MVDPIILGLMERAVPPEYVFSDRDAVYHGILFNGEVPYALKYYEFQKGNPPEPVDAKYRIGLQEHLDNEIMNKRINPQSGLGYLIVSDKYLNVNFFGDINVVTPNLYAFDEENSIWEEANVKEKGAYCVWEFKIGMHEIDQWVSFLKSKRTADDMQKFWASFTSGALYP